VWGGGRREPVARRSAVAIRAVHDPPSAGRCWDWFLDACHWNMMIMVVLLLCVYLWCRLLVPRAALRRCAYVRCAIFLVSF
jgi:hypothetical protein